MTLERPLKRAGTRRYVDEVAAGQPYIYEDEVDGDLDPLYAAANAPPVIPAGTITTGMLADGAATMRKLGLTRTVRRGTGTVPARATLTDTFGAVVSVGFSTTGGLCLVTGTLQFEFDGTPTKGAIGEARVDLDGAPQAIHATNFAATGTPFVVPYALLAGFRPPAGPHTLAVLARNAGEAGTSVAVLPSTLDVEELE